MKKLLTILLLSVSFLATMAQDSLSYRLEEFVFSSSRWCQDRDSQPVKVGRITFEEGNAYNPQTAADLLGLTGEVFIQKSQYGGGSPMIRGFSANRLLYSVDGVRMNTAIFRSGNLQNVISLDPFAFGSTEVLFGPGAVSYGSDAIGGAMVFSTLHPQLSKNDKPLFNTSATLRTATASGEFTGHLHLGVGFKKWALLTSYTASSFGDLEQGLHGPEDYIKPFVVYPSYSPNGVDDRVVANSDERMQSPSNYSQHNFMQKLRYAPGCGWNLEYAFHYSETSEYARYDRHLRMRDGMPRYAEWNYGPQKWMMNHLRVEHAGENAVYDSLRLNVALQRFAESRISRDLGKQRRETQSEKVDAWSVNVDFLKHPIKDLTISYGAEYVLNDVSSKGVATNVVTGETAAMESRYPEALWHSIGIYAQAEWHITNRLNLASGVRYSYYIIDSDFSTAGYDVPFALKQTSSAGNVSGNVGLNWRPKFGWLFRLNYARGFRAPNIDDMGKLFDSADGCVTVPNPDLKPEYADNVEVGIAKRFGKFLEADITAYYTHLDNAIVRRDYSFNGSTTMMYKGQECRVQALQNAAVAKVYGVQVAVDARFAKWFYVKGNVNWQRGREELDNGESSPSRHAVPLFGRVAVGCELKRFTVEAYSMFQAECSADDMPFEERDKKEIYALDSNGNPYSPAWYTLNLRASYHFADRLILNATVENIADIRYRPYSCGISAPGRNITFSLTYKL